MNSRPNGSTHTIPWGLRRAPPHRQKPFKPSCKNSNAGNTREISFGPLQSIRLISPGNHLVDEHLWVLWTYGWFPFLLGWIPACLCIFVGSGFKSQVTRGLFLGVGILLMREGYLMGVERGYSIWQSLPNPPDEALSDTDAAAGLFLSWLPSLAFLGCLHALLIRIRHGRQLPTPLTIFPIYLPLSQKPTHSTDNETTF